MSFQNWEGTPLYEPSSLLFEGAEDWVDFTVGAVG